MTIKGKRSALASIALIALGASGANGQDVGEAPEAAGAEATQPAQQDEGSALARMLSGRSAIEGEALEAKVEEASAFPLGSQKNPVRAQMPQGQRAYLSRLRCADLSRPSYVREGSFGVGVYGNIIDAYEVTCEDSGPAKVRVFMDMYHAGFVETNAIPGFGIVNE